MRIAGPLLCALYAVALCALGCGPSLKAARGGEAAEAGGQPVRVSDESFAQQAYQLLMSGESKGKRHNLLVGVVRRQLVRAERRFAAGHPEAGLHALSGALYLVRAGEFDPSMLEHASVALSAAASEVARLGDEGRSFALYSMLLKILPPGAERTDVEQHLGALQRWSKTQERAGPLQALGADQRAAVQRALFEPTQQALDAARRATEAWIVRALQSNIGERVSAQNLDREEILEVSRAIRFGGIILTALYLRHGDARGALDALGKGPMADVLPRWLRDWLERAADSDDPESWAELYRFYSSAASAGRPDLSVDPELAQAAAWGTAVELFRSLPGSPASTLPLGFELVERGMAEVAPLVLASGLAASPTAQDVNAAMSVVMQAIRTEEEALQLPGARRAFAGAQPILALAESKKFAGRIRPISAARLRYVMGMLEMRSGELERAKPHIEAAARAEGSVDALNALAAIDRQRGDSEAALRWLRRVVGAGERAGEPVVQAEALITIFEIHRDLGHVEAAKQALQTALTRTLEARQRATVDPDRAQAERLLARVLEHYGNAEAARRATERAYAASRSDIRQFTATVMDASRRALTQYDLSLARDAVRRAIDADLNDEDIIYATLWLQLLERKLNVPSDGTAEEAYARIEDASGWPGKLRAWARGKLNDQELFRSARDRIQRVEALFYSAMAEHVGGQREAALPKLQQVAQSEAIDLIEVKIARDLLAEQRGVHVPLPAGIALP